MPSFCTYFQRPEPSPGEVGVPHGCGRLGGGGKNPWLAFVSFLGVLGHKLGRKTQHLSEIQPQKLKNEYLNFLK